MGGSAGENSLAPSWVARFPGTVHVRWVDRDALDRRTVDGAVAVLEAVRAADFPHEPATSAAYRAWLVHGWDGEPPELAVLDDVDGRVTAALELSLPRRDNTHLGYVDLWVDPQARRQGQGRMLFEAAVTRIRAEGRRLVMTGSFDTTAGPPFLTAMGLTRASSDVKRRQDLRRLDRERVGEIAATAGAAARDYELLRFTTCPPDELLPATATMVAAINDAPLDDLKYEDEVFSPDRVRAFWVAQAARGRRVYQLVARRRGTGELAGHTVVGVEADQPHYAHQLDTSVLAGHRGHRLGLLLKAEMLCWLAHDEPHLRVLDTWNAASNDHMIAVNETLGYVVIATGGEWQLEL